MLREGKPLDVYCTEMVKQDLTTGFPLFNMLADYCTVNHHPIPFDGSSFTIPGIDDLRFYTQALKSKAPPYSPTEMIRMTATISASSSSKFQPAKRCLFPRSGRNRAACHGGHANR
jgi:hypothetical protein